MEYETKILMINLKAKLFIIPILQIYSIRPLKITTR